MAYLLHKRIVIFFMAGLLRVSVLALFLFLLYQKLRVVVIPFLMNQICVQKVPVVLLVLFYLHLRVLGLF